MDILSTAYLVLQNSATVANYCYLSDGTKLSAVNGSGNGLVYSGSLVYNKRGGNLTLESASFTGGRFVASSTGFTPHYFVTDHLGSVRAIVNDSGGVEEQSDYYPFGSRWDDGQISDNRYLFNGKEAQAFVDVPYLDYGARQYDPLTGRWFNIDLLAEKYYSISPYAYCAGNPVKFIDPDGRFIGTAIGTIVGGLKGAYDAHKNGTDVWAGAAEGAVAGFITGATVDLAVGATIATGGGALAVIGVGAVAGAVGGAAGAVAGDATGQVVEQRSNNEIKIQTDNFGDKALNGAITGGVSGLSGGILGTMGKAAASSTKAIQETMSNNITTTATALTTQGASQATVNTAVSSIAKGMGTAGANTANTMLKVEASASIAIESSIKITENQLNKK